jgi:NAD(P)-dependent dehydrogenase (short-subunit alcohol dehydrogenase family)
LPTHLTHVRTDLHTHSSGIGFHTTKQLYARGATVYLACRSETRAHAAMAEIEREMGAAPSQSKLRFLQLDLASLHATKAAAEEFARREERLDVLSASRSSPFESFF